MTPLGLPSQHKTAAAAEPPNALILEVPPARRRNVMSSAAIGRLTVNSIPTITYYLGIVDASADSGGVELCLDFTDAEEEEERDLLVYRNNARGSAHVG